LFPTKGLQTEAIEDIFKGLLLRPQSALQGRAFTSYYQPNK